MGDLGIAGMLVSLRRGKLMVAKLMFGQVNYHGTATNRAESRTAKAKDELAGISDLA
jgi:hypothetical protein